jgi:enoyl-CoA hydratase/carnithine racemase
MTAIEFEVIDEIAFITLNRPEKLNAINDDVLNGLYDAMDKIATSDSIGAAVVNGRGRAFSAGGDIKAMEAMDDRSFANTISLYMRVSAAFRSCPRPIVAAIHGYALAGGFELACMCDVRFAARGTKFGLPDTPLGLSPTSGMTWLLPRIIGLGRAMYLTLLADNIDADEAERIGFVNRVTDPDVLLSEASTFARRIASYPRVGVAWTKRGFQSAMERDFGSATRQEEEGELTCFRSPDTQDRFRGFLNRKRD